MNSAKIKWVIGIFILALVAALSLWIYTAKQYGDAVFLHLWSVAILTLSLCCILQERSPKKREWWFLNASLILSAVFWFHCGYPLERSFFLEYLFGFLVFQWFLYIACIAMKVVLEEDGLTVQQSILCVFPLCLAMFIALLKVQWLELDTFHQVFYSSWYYLIFSVQGVMTLGLAVGAGVLLVGVMRMVSYGKIRIAEGVLMLSLLIILCALAHPRYLFFPLCALPGVYLCMFFYLKNRFSARADGANKRKETIYGWGVFLCLLIGLVVGDGWILIPLGLHLFLAATILFLSRHHPLYEFNERRWMLIQTSLIAAGAFTLLWLAILTIRGVDRYKIAVVVSPVKEEAVHFSSLPDLEFKVKLKIRISYDKVGKNIEMGSARYQYARIGLVNSEQQEELLKHKNNAFSDASSDYYQKWSRDLLHNKDLSVGELHKACPPQYVPSRGSVVKVSEGIWLDSASGIVYELSSIGDEYE